MKHRLALSLLVATCFGAACQDKATAPATPPPEVHFTTEAEFVAHVDDGRTSEARVLVGPDGVANDWGAAPRPFAYGDLSERLIIPELKEALARRTFVRVSKSGGFKLKLGEVEVAPEVPFLKVAAAAATLGDTGHNYLRLSGVARHLPKDGRLLVALAEPEPAAVVVIVDRFAVRVRGGGSDARVRLGDDTAWGFDRPALQALLASAVGQDGASRSLTVAATPDAPWESVAAVLGVARYRLDLPKLASEREYDAALEARPASQRAPLFERFQLSLIE